MSSHRYVNQILHNRSFKGLDLTGVDFSGSDLRGCDFTGATLVDANFAGARTGQSREQVNRLIAAAVVIPALFVGLSLLVVQIPIHLFGDRFFAVFDFLMKGLPLLVFILEIFFRDAIAVQFPRTTSWIGVVGIAGFFQVMVTFTLFLLIVSLSSFGSGESAQGLFLFVLAVISAIVTRRIFSWVTDSIKSCCGTSFRKANLTNANLSQAVIQNTDFSFAVLTGVCIFAWTIQRYTEFSNVYCDYLYLEPDHQKRHPEIGKFRQSEVEQFLSAPLIDKKL